MRENDQIPENWQLKKIEEMANKLVVGFVGPCYAYYCNKNLGVPMIKTGNLTDNGIDFTNLDYVTYEFHKKNEKSQVYKGDILIARHGQNGLACTYDEEREAHALNVIIFRPNKEVCVPKFMYHVLKSSMILEQIYAHSSGTVQDVLNTKALAKLVFLYPPLNEQNKISEILDELDSQINTLTNINKKLENIIESIFKSWFVDLDGQTEFVDSELGKIPKGWRVEKFHKVIELSYGKSLTAERRMNGNIPVYGSSGIVGYHNELLVKGPGIIVGRKGNVGTVFLSERDFYPIDTTYYVKTEIPLSYIYHILKHMNFINSDSSVPGLQREQAYSLDVIIPDSALMNKFVGIANVTYKIVQKNKDKMSFLIQIRDSLLPKLMSGEIRV